MSICFVLEKAINPIYGVGCLWWLGLFVLIWDLFIYFFIFSKELCLPSVLNLIFLGGEIHEIALGM